MNISPVTLYGLERSVYTRIARLALVEKGVPYTLEEVEIFGPGGAPASHFSMHPFGRIPVLSHGEFTLFETAAITRYIDEAFEGPALQPVDVVHRARMNQTIGLLDSYAYRPLVWGVFVQRVRLPLQGKGTDEGEVTRSLESAKPILNVLHKFLSHEPYLAGPAISLADLHAFPMLRYFALAQEGATLMRQYPAILRWFEHMLSRASTQCTSTQYERP